MSDYVENNLRELLDRTSRECGRLEAENASLRKRLARAEEAVVELQAMNMRAQESA